MKKIIVLLLFAFLLTGCSATYDVEIYKDKVKEKLQYVNTNSTTWNEVVSNNVTYKSMVESSVKNSYPAFIDAIINEDDSRKGVDYYKSKLISDDYKLGQELSYNKFKLLDNYNNSFIIRSCYKYFNVIESEDKDTIVISTSLQNTCFDKYEKLDSLVIHLKTNHKVVSHNANVVNGYHYTWNITRDKKDNAPILMTIKKNDYIFNYENEFIKKILTIGGIAAIIIIVVGRFSLNAKRKHDILNKI